MLDVRFDLFDLFYDLFDDLFDEIFAACSQIKHQQHLKSLEIIFIHIYIMNTLMSELYSQVFMYMIF